ncbi:MAG: hypothetical protein PHE53_11270 [Thermoguttaceae bacterium]|nr:hypothetical protein [Thermoguttaceae bacterium]
MFYRLSRLLFGCSLMLWMVSPAVVYPVVAQDAEEGIDISADSAKDANDTDLFDLVQDADSDSTNAAADNTAVANGTTAEDEELFTGDDTFSMEDVQPDATSDAAFDDTVGDTASGTDTADSVDTTDGTADAGLGGESAVSGDTASGNATDTTISTDVERDPVASVPVPDLPKRPAADMNFEPVDEVPAPVAIRSTPITPWRGAQRRNAPGVVKEVVSSAEPKDAVTRYDLTLPGLVGQNGDLSWMKDVPLRRELWMLEFRFKPVGIIDVDIPQPSGKVQKKKIWYLVYSVKNTGNVVVPKQGKDLMYSLEPSAKSVRFFPRFIFESTNTNKLYRDQILPIAVDAIQRREGTKFQLLNTVEAVREIAPGEEISGVVTWDTIDPMTNKFSIYVQGLTNAYIWKQATGANGGVELTEGKTYRKTLKVNFLRRGDQYLIREDQILYGVSGGLDWQWVYR